MRMIDSVVQQYSHSEHPLGQGLEPAEALTMLQPLRQRLKASEKDLDLSPASVKRLERHLVEFLKNIESQSVTFEDDELVQFVREIAAYLGLVLVHHADGQWVSSRTLYTSAVDIPGPIRVIDGRTSYTSPSPMLIFVGHIASASLELIQRGMQPVLYTVFSAAKRKISKQDLKPKK